MKWSSILKLLAKHTKNLPLQNEWKKIWFKPTESDPFRICEKICEAPRNGQECANIWTEKSWNGFDDMQMRPFRSVGNVKSNSMKNETAHNILCYSNSNRKMKRTVNVRKNGRIRWKPHTFIQLMIILHAFQYSYPGLGFFIQFHMTLCSNTLNLLILAPVCTQIEFCFTRPVEGSVRHIHFHELSIWCYPHTIYT